MDLKRDWLDRRLVDCNGRNMGRIDDIVLTLCAGAPPRAAAIEVGPTALAEGLPALFRRVVMFFARRTGRHHTPSRIAMLHLRDTGPSIDVDFDGEVSGVLAWEAFLRERVVKRLPGAER